MASGNEGGGAAPRDAGRRALLKAATVAGGAAAASALLPGSWKKPAATLGGLPAHAQTSQAITLTRPQASVVPPDRSAVPTGVTPILAQCGYEDAVGDFGVGHQVTVTQGLPVRAVGKFDCSAPQTFSLADLTPTIDGDGTVGTLSFVVNATCFPPGWISWYLHRGDHVSNVVNASVLSPDA